MILPDAQRDYFVNLLSYFQAVGKSYCIYGTGKVSRDLVFLVERLQLLRPLFVMDENVTSDLFRGCPLLDIQDFELGLVDEIVLGTNTYQETMREKVNSYCGVEVKTIDLSSNPDESGLKNVPLHCCYNCKNGVNRFLSLAEVSGEPIKWDYINTFCPVGSDPVNFECPICGCWDRHRHLLMFFDVLGYGRHFHQARILHFAPEPVLSNYIFLHAPDQYIKADVEVCAPDWQRIDMTDIPYPDGSFDFIMANHVLEHIVDVEKALDEIQRVLKVGGRAILQTPYSAVLEETLCDVNINTGELRARHYGQHDHVRLFGRDLFSLLGGGAV